ncbi:MAG: class I SAM-dependent methyltransferase, partial [Promethearchaeota archaeon]
MLLKFQSKFIISECLKRTPNLLLSDIEYLPFRDNVFSSIFSITSFQNLPQLEKGINESFRVSKSNADFRFSTLKKNLNLKSLFKILNTKITSLKTIETEDLEDIILEGRYFKD